MDHEVQLMWEMKQRICQSQPKVLRDVDAVLTYGAGGYEVVRDGVALARSCPADRRTAVSKARVQGGDDEF